MQPTIIHVSGGEPLDTRVRGAVAAAIRGASVTRCEGEAEFADALSAAGGGDAVVLVPARPAFSSWRELLGAALSRRPEAIVVFLPSEGADALAVEAIRAGADDALPPSRLEDLPSLVARAAARRSRCPDRERNRAIAEAASDYAYSIRIRDDGAPAVEWVSSGFERLTGFALCERELGLGFDGIAHPEDAPALARREAALRAGRPSDTEFRVLARGGGVRFVRDRCQPLLDATGEKLVRVDGGAIDVTALRRSEDERRVLESRFDTLLLQMPAGVEIAEAKSGHTIRSNPLAREIRKDLRPASDDGTPVSAFLARSLHGGEVITEEDVEIERRDGSVGVIRCSSSPVRKDGEIVEAIALFSDVTESMRTERDLLASTNSFRALFDSADIGIVVTDPEGSLIESNRAFKRLLGHGPETLASMRFPEFAGAPGENARPVRFERDYRHADGSLVRASVIVTHVRERAADAGCAIAFVEDVTDRYRAEENIRQASRQLKLVTDALPVLLSYVGKDGRYQFVNKTYEDWFGRRREEILDRPMTEIVPPEIWETIRPFVRRALGGETVRFMHQSSLAGSSRRDFDVTYVPDLGPDGAVRGFFVHVADVTDWQKNHRSRRRLAKKLLKERSILRAVLAQAPTGLVVGEAPSGRLTLANKRLSEILRHPFFPTREIGEYSQWSGFHPDGRPLVPEEWPLARAIREGATVKDEEIHYARGDGSRAVLSISGAPILDRRGRTVAGVVAVSDVTDERRRAEEARELARDLARRVGEFETLFNVMPMCVAIAEDKDCRRIRVNDYSLALFGLAPRGNFSLSAPEGERPPWRCFRDGRPLATHELPIQRCVATGKVVLNDVMDWEVAPGRVIRIRTHAAPLFDEKNDVRGCVAVFEPVALPAR